MNHEGFLYEGKESTYEEYVKSSAKYMLFLSIIDCISLSIWLGNIFAGLGIGITVFLLCTSLVEISLSLRFKLRNL